MSRFFDDMPPDGRLIHIPKARPDYSVIELIEYSDEVIRIPVGSAWKREHTLIEVPGAVYELVPLSRGSDLFNGGQSSPPLPPTSAAQGQLASLITH